MYVEEQQNKQQDMRPPPWGRSTVRLTFWFLAATLCLVSQTQCVTNMIDYINLTVWSKEIIKSISKQKWHWER